MKIHPPLHLALALPVFFFSLNALANPEPLEIGAKAPEFRLTGVDDKEYTLADFADADVLAMVFTCNHCPTAQAYEERLKDMVKHYEGRPVAIVAISPNDDEALRLDELGYSDLGDSFEDMKIRARDHEFNFPYLYDGDTQEMSRAYGPVSTPHVFVFDKERVLRYTGRIDDAEDPARVQTHDMRNAIDALLAGQPVRVEKTRAIGCSTKWSDKRDTVQAAFERWAQEPVELEAVDAATLREFIANDTDKLRLVNVWATWCVPCLDEFPELVEMHRMYRGRKFELVTIAADSPEKQGPVVEFLKKQQASTRNLIFHTPDVHAMADAIDARWDGGLPYTMLIAPGGEVLHRVSGRFDSLELKRAIVDFLGRTYYQSR